MPCLSPGFLPDPERCGRRLSLAGDIGCPRRLTIRSRRTDDFFVHIPDGLLGLESSLSTAVVSAGAVGYSLRRIRQELPDRAAPLMGMTAACLFAAQTLNVPLLIAPASGHLLGGVLAAVLLGPWGGLVTVASVLVVQCLLFQDGGLTALGANVFLLGVIGSGAGYAIFATLRRWLPGLTGPGRVVGAATVAAWCSVQLSAIAACLLIAAGPNFDLHQILGVMMVAHSVIGLGEAAITGLALSLVLRTRPDLIYGGERPGGGLSSVAQLTLTVCAAATLLAAIAAPIASELPDGLERTLVQVGFDAAAAANVLGAPFAEYRVPGLEQLAVAGSIATTLGVAAVFLLAFGMARSSAAGVSTTSHRTHG